MVFLQQSWLSYKGLYSAYSKEEIFAGQLASPIMSMVFYCLLASYSFSTKNLTSWVIGNSFLLSSNICIFSLGGFIVSDRYYGRLKYIFLSDRPIFIALLEKSFFSILSSTLVVIVGLILGATFFQTDIKMFDLPVLIIFILITIFSTAMFGIFISTFGLFSDSMNLFLNTAYIFLLIFTGVNFPLDYLPSILQKIAHLLPMTNALQGVRRIVVEGMSLESNLFLFKELGVGIAYFLLSVLMIKVAEKIALRNNTVDLF